MANRVGEKFFSIIALVLLPASGIILIGLQLQLYGWLLLLLGSICLLGCRQQFRKDIILIYLALALLGLTRISTDISWTHIAQMSLTLCLALIIPFVMSKYLWRDSAIRYRWHHGRAWYRTEILYVVTTAVLAYFILPLYLKNTGAYLNWTVEPGVSHLVRLFLGTQALGFWDELFFVCTVLGLLRRHLSFPIANIIQSILFTSFLYELGFTGWGFAMIFIFALIQGFVFKKTDSLLYVITIHLTLDVVLFLALLWAHHPTWMPIFLVG